ncbi:MAG: NPCBM/NEW2 domain-containing protein [Clostridia bacterium]|nr:NPCBM/NEW2 domain-containing protein [Clostridia bacterium]
MKKRLQGFVAGLLIGVMSIGGIAGAKEISENVEVFYNNIKIFIDGAEIVPKDAVGNTVEPFIMNGTTYLPVRAVASAFGKEVEWDGATASVYIGKKDETKPDNYLHKIQYNDYREASIWSDFAIINGTVTDHNNNVYTNGILFSVYTGQFEQIEDDDDAANIIISYPLNSQYDTLKGKIVIPKKYDINVWKPEDDSASDTSYVLFYGDGKLLYKATAVTASMPHSFDIDTSGVNQLSIKVTINSPNAGYPKLALTDLALYK